MFFYKSELAGVPVVFDFRYPETHRFYGSWLEKTEMTDSAVTVPQEDIERWYRMWNATDCAYSEYVISCSYACDCLLQHRKAVFHGAAFLFRGKAYIFTAPSGTGKTTQLNLWKSLYGDEIEILNGDKPIIEAGDQILLYPSPWKGKEGMGRDDIIAPLGGIIMLKQDKENSIRRLNPDEPVRTLFARFYSTFKSESEVKSAASVLESVLNHVPVWLLKNKGDTASAELTYRALREVDG